MRLPDLLMVGPLLVALGACSGTTFVELPELTSGLETLIIDVDGQLTAYEATESLHVVVEGRQVALLFYPEPLDALELEPGPIDAGTMLNCQLASPRKAYELLDERFVEGTASDEVLDHLVPDREARCPKCLNLEVTRFPLDEWEEDPLTDQDTRPEAAAWLLSNDALLGRRIGGLFVTSISSTQRVSGCEQIEVRSILAVGDDRFFIGSESAIFEVEIDQPSLSCTQTASATDPLLTGFVAGLSGTWSGSDRELFLFISDGSLVRYSPDGFEAIGALDLHSEDAGRGFSDAGGVVRTAPGHAHFSSGGADILEFGDGRTSKRTLEVQVALKERIQTIASIPGFGILAGSNIGTLFSSGAGWREIPSGLEGGIGSLVPFRGGFVATTAGLVIQHTSLGEVCKPIGPIVGSRHDGQNAIATDTQILVPRMILSNDGGRLSELIWLTHD